MNDVRKIASNYIDEVKRSGILVEKAFLFGSYAKGKANKYSDIDVCVVSPVFGDDYIGNMVSLRKIALAVDSKIEPIPFAPGDLEDRYSSLASEIKRTGIRI